MPVFDRVLAKRLVLLCALSQAACETTLQGPSVEPPPQEPHEELPIFDPIGCAPTGDSVRATIFEPACGSATCHGPPTPALGLDLVSAAADSLVGVTAAGCEGHALLVPGSPELSFLYEKVTSATPACGDPMPLDAVLSEGGKACLAQWIQSLAPEGGCEKCGGDACVVLAADPTNCGACGNACDAGLICASGACSCPGGATFCDSVCVDTLADAANCGACGNVCAAGASCRDGQCACPAPTRDCGGTCVDLDSNASHCGACDNACPSGSGCSGGQCDCSPPLTSCGGGCVDVASDPTHCGECGAACASGEVCLLASCSTGCGTLTQCGSSCVDTDTSTLHCGGCNEACAAGLECAGGECTCPGGRTLCGTACADTSTDPTNCGDCGRTCGPSDACVSGVCECDSSAAVSFSSVIAPKLEAACAGTGCHSGARPKENLLLTAATAFDELVGVASQQCAGKVLVDPGSPSTSYLMNKLLGQGMCSGTAMPKADTRLPQAELDAISAWICAGAADD